MVNSIDEGFADKDCLKQLFMPPVLECGLRCILSYFMPRVHEMCEGCFRCLCRDPRTKPIFHSNICRMETSGFSDHRYIVSDLETLWTKQLQQTSQGLTKDPSSHNVKILHECVHVCARVCMRACVNVCACMCMDVCACL